LKIERVGNGIVEVVSAPTCPWQNAFVEGVIEALQFRKAFSTGVSAFVPED
jgi:hypothetical protein